METQRQRGALSQIQGRFETVERARIRRRLGARGRAARAAADHGDRGAGALDHRAQRFARHPLRPVDQPVPGLRAWLHLLLCPAEPRLPRALARAGFRDEAVRQDQRGGAAEARSWPSPATRSSPMAFGTNTDCYQPTERKLPASRAQMHRSARGVRPPAHHRHQVGAGRARPRPARADGEEEPGQGVRLHRHARPRCSRASLEPRAASPQRRLDALRALSQAGSALRRDGRGADPGADRQDARSRCWRRRRRPARRRPARSSCACRTK